LFKGLSRYNDERQGKFARAKAIFDRSAGEHDPQALSVTRPFL
jgi:hypothetical protein